MTGMGKQFYQTDYTQFATFIESKSLWAFMLKIKLENNISLPGSTHCHSRDFTCAHTTRHVQFVLKKSTRSA